LDRKS
ncbi:hypothetical protein TrRE_jg3197, partial [Triparma retinervis]